MLDLSEIVDQHALLCSLRRVHVQVVVMFAAQSNMLKDIDAESVPELLAAYTALLRDQHPDLLRDIAASNLLPSGCHEILEQSLRECVNAFSDFGL